MNADHRDDTQRVSHLQEQTIKCSEDGKQQQGNGFNLPNPHMHGVGECFEYKKDICPERRRKLSAETIQTTIKTLVEFTPGKEISFPSK